MSWAFVQARPLATSSGTSVTSGSFTLTAGNCVFVGIRAGYGGADHSVTSLTDTLGNTYTFVDHVKNSSLFGGECGDIFVCQNCIGGTGTMTATLPASSAYNQLIILEYSGLALTSIVDVHNTVIPGSGTTLSLPLTTTFADTLIVGYFVHGDPSVSASSLTDRSGGFFGGSGCYGEQEKTPAGSTNVTGTASTSAAWIALAVALKIAGGGPPPASRPVVCVGY